MEKVLHEYGYKYSDGSLYNLTWFEISRLSTACLLELDEQDGITPTTNTKFEKFQESLRKKNG